jgi:hypothetical protein
MAREAGAWAGFGLKVSGAKPMAIDEFDGQLSSRPLLDHCHDAGDFRLCT